MQGHGRLHQLHVTALPPSPPPGGYSTEFLDGEALPRGQTPSLLYTISEREGILFRITVFIHPPFHILCAERCISFNCCKCTVFQL